MCKNSMFLFLLGGYFSSLYESSTGEKDSRILRGDPVFPPHSRPYVVQIYSSGKTIPKGGIILDKTTIITLANGLDKIDKIMAGKFKLKEHEDSEQERKVCTFAAHPNYRGNFAYDFGLLFLKEPLTFNEYVKPICIAMEGIDLNHCYAIGWGRVTEGNGSELSKELRQALVKFKDPSTCVFGHETLTCLEEGGCWWDWGAPVVCRDRGREKVVALINGVHEPCNNTLLSNLIKLSQDWIGEVKEKANKICGHQVSEDAKEFRGFSISNKLATLLCDNYAKSKLSPVLQSSLPGVSTCPVYKKYSGSNSWTVHNCDDDKIAGVKVVGSGNQPNPSPRPTTTTTKLPTSTSSEPTTPPVVPTKLTTPPPEKTTTENIPTEPMEGAAPFSHRYLVYIRAEGRATKGLSGIIYNRYTILTNARQLSNLLKSVQDNTDRIRIHIGKHKHSERENEEQVRWICSYENHPRYNENSTTHEYDYAYAAISLYDPITFNNYADKIPVASHLEKCSVSNECLLPNWGTNIPPEFTLEILEETNVSLHECPFLLRSNDNQLCSDPPYCSVDAGSPAVCTLQHRIYASALVTEQLCPERRSALYEDLKLKSIIHWAENVYKMAVEKCRPCKKFELN